MNYLISQSFDLSEEVKDLEYKSFIEDKLVNTISFKLSENHYCYLKEYMVTNLYKIDCKEKSVNTFIRSLILAYINIIKNKNNFNVRKLPTQIAQKTTKQHCISFLLTQEQWQVLEKRRIKIKAKNVNILIKNVVLNWILKKIKE